MIKKIVLLSDGTGNSAAKRHKTNVWRLYIMLKELSRCGEQRINKIPALPDPTVLEDRAVAAAEADDAVEFAPDALQPPLAEAHAALGPERPHAQAALPPAHVDLDMVVPVIRLREKHYQSWTPGAGQGS